MYQKRYCHGNNKNYNWKCTLLFSVHNSYDNVKNKIYKYIEQIFMENVNQLF